MSQSSEQESHLWNIWSRKTLESRFSRLHLNCFFCLNLIIYATEDANRSPQCFTDEKHFYIQYTYQVPAKTKINPDSLSLKIFSSLFVCPQTAAVEARAGGRAAASGGLNTWIHTSLRSDLQPLNSGRWVCLSLRVSGLELDSSSQVPLNLSAAARWRPLLGVRN